MTHCFPRLTAIALVHVECYLGSGFSVERQHHMGTLLMTTPANQNTGCLSFLLNLFKPDDSKSNSPEFLSYQVRDDFLTPAEFSFYRTLSFVAGTHVTICPKVRLADILFVSRPKDRLASFNRIAQRHVDFLVCDAASMKPLIALELDDSSHDRPARQVRDEFMDKAFLAAGLPLLRIPAQRSYSQQAIAAQLAPFLRDQAQPTIKSAPAEANKNSETQLAPLCPKCGVPMVARVAVKGRHQGEQFYGCPNYPQCRAVQFAESQAPAASLENG